MLAPAEKYITLRDKRYRTDFKVKYFLCKNIFTTHTEEIWLDPDPAQYRTRSKHWVQVSTDVLS